MISDKQYKPYEEKMKKTISVLEEEFSLIRAGRANPNILNSIMIDYYGVPTPLPQVGNISVPEARLLQIQPWDAGILSAIEKAILASDLGITPNNDGKVIRLVFPELTEERRKDLTKEVKKKGEESKVSIRNIRREAIDDFKKMEKNKELTEDELKVAETDIQELTDHYVELIDKKVEEKNKEILSI
ncbi:MAG: ribosome recycling factor [Epulopiscium sp.]|nr:ribosome recycling factor [Candidatus Epulonipiscium sp.]